MPAYTTAIIAVLAMVQPCDKVKTVLRSYKDPAGKEPICVMCNPKNSSDLVSQLSRSFRETMGYPEGVICFAPGRVNLIGEHIDYNGGHVFPCALTLGTYGAAARRTDNKIRLYSMDFPDDGILETNLSSIRTCTEKHWGKYALGVVWAFQEKGLSIPSGFDFVCKGDLPPKAGLSSSASLEVLVGTVLRTLFSVGDPADPAELPLLAQMAENQYVGMNCGIMDQFASANGKKDHALLLDCASLDFRYAPLDLQDCRIVIANTNKPHELVGSAYNDRRAECEEALSDLRTVLPDLPALCALTPADFDVHKEAIRRGLPRRRAAHAVSEEARTLAAFDALQHHDLSAFGRLMNESHISLRDDFEVSCPELDLLAELAWQTDGVLGARMTGGGFGGCTVNIVHQDALAVFTEKTNAAYRARFGYEASFYVVRPGDGAALLS